MKAINLEGVCQSAAEGCVILLKYSKCGSGAGPNATPVCAGRRALPVMAITFESDARGAASDSQAFFRHFQALACDGPAPGGARTRQAQQGRNSLPIY
jgi:hypothetical protein